MKEKRELTYSIFWVLWWSYWSLWIVQEFIKDASNFEGVWYLLGICVAVTYLVLLSYSISSFVVTLLEVSKKIKGE